MRASLEHLQYEAHRLSNAIGHNEVELRLALRALNELCDQQEKWKAEQQKLQKLMKRQPALHDQLVELIRRLEENLKGGAEQIRKTQESVKIRQGKIDGHRVELAKVEQLQCALRDADTMEG